MISSDQLKAISGQLKALRLNLRPVNKSLAGSAAFFYWQNNSLSKGIL
jgi:hypothetical protein